jgi:hypothetical protein
MTIIAITSTNNESVWIKAAKNVVHIKFISLDSRTKKNPEKSLNSINIKQEKVP